MKRIHLALLVGLLVAGGLAVALTQPFTATAGEEAAQASKAQVALHVDGMTCASCSTAVRLALKRLDGVVDATVSFDEKRAVVTYDPKRVAPEKMVAAIADLGYTAKVEGDEGKTDQKS